LLKTQPADDWIARCRNISLSPTGCHDGFARGRGKIQARRDPVSPRNRIIFICQICWPALHLMEEEPRPLSLPLILLLAVGLCLAMAFAWAVQRATGKSGWIDAIWSLATGLAAMAAAVVPAGGLTLAGIGSGRAWMVTVMAGLWALRLSGHIAARTRFHGEDPRYAALQGEWGPRFPLRLFLFLQVQALAGLMLAVSVGAAAANPAPFPLPGDGLALAIFFISFVGESVADRQLERFRRANPGRKAVCEVGLWRYSRHPNYFFEWLGWWAYPLAAISLAGSYPFGWLALLAPALMYILLVHASGIPPLETEMIASRGDAFRAYQGRVNAFFPGPRRHDTAEMPAPPPTLTKEPLP
jgi:steroid 5-alpha reductase family enzyme